MELIGMTGLIASIFSVVVFCIFMIVVIAILVQLGDIKHSIQSVERLLKFKMLSEEDKKFFPREANEGYFRTKKCPDCNGIIWYGSKACRFCGLDLR